MKGISLPHVLEDDADGVGVEHQRRELAGALDEVPLRGEPRERPGLREEIENAHRPDQVRHGQVELKEEVHHRSPDERPPQQQGRGDRQHERDQCRGEGDVKGEDEGEVELPGGEHREIGIEVRLRQPDDRHVVEAAQHPEGEPAEEQHHDDGQGRGEQQDDFRAIGHGASHRVDTRGAGVGSALPADFTDSRLRARDLLGLPPASQAQG